MVFGNGIIKPSGMAGGLIESSDGSVPSYFLDDFSSVNWLVNVGLRQLSSSGGNLIRVQETGGSTQQDFGAVAGNLDTAGIDTFIGANDGQIVSVYEQGGGTDKFYQGTLAQRPLVGESGTVVELTNNGKTRPFFKFDSSDDDLRYSNSGGTEISPLSTAMTAFSAVWVAAPVVAVTTNQAGLWDGHFGLASSSSARVYAIYGGTNTAHRTTAFARGTGGSAGSVIGDTTNVMAGEAHVYSIIWTTSAFNFYIDGVSVANSTTMGNPSALSTSALLRLGVRFGTSFTDNGNIYMGEYHMADGDISGNLAAIVADLKAYWGTP